MILPIADKIFGDEKAIALYEMHEQSLGSKGFHRYQIIHVPRNGVICEWRKDMGSADNYKGISQLRIPGGVVDDSGKFYSEHTVDELKAIADEMRYKKIDIRDLLQLENYIPG